MKQLLNISTHDVDLETIGHDWSTARKLMENYHFDGYELYPVTGYAFEEIPLDLVTGLHLRFFVIIEPIWRGNRQRLLEIFDDEETIRFFYGGLDKYALVEAYREQLALAHHFGCEYVVFHVSQCEFEYVYKWNCPWTWQETVDISAEIINEVTQETPYQGLILFENLWWPGSMRLDSPAEVERLMERVDYPHCGIILDTGHILNKNQDLRNEAEGISYILETVSNLGQLRSLVKGVHLSCSLSAEYVKQSMQITEPFREAKNFWDRFIIAHDHASKIDQHDPFEDPAIAGLFDLVSPEFLVFELTYRDMAEWQYKIERQKRAIDGAGGPV